MSQIKFGPGAVMGESTENSASALQLERVLNRLDALQNKLDKQEISSSRDEKKPKSLTESAAQFLGIPVILVGLLLTWSQIRTEQTNPALNQANEVKAYAEATKAQAEAKQILVKLSSLQDKTDADRKASLEQVDRLIPVIKRNLEELSRQTEQKSTSQILLRYIVLMLALTLFGLIISLVNWIWSALIGLVDNFLISLRPRWRSGGHPDDYEKKSARWETIQSVWRYTSIFVRPLPFFLEMTIRLAIFFSVFVPLIDMTAIALGSDIRFQKLWAAAKSLHIAQAIEILRQLVLATGVISSPW